MLQLWLVLDNPALLNDVLAAWTDAGVRGITILESTGVHRVRTRASKQDMPFMLGFSRLLRTDQVGHYTLFAVVPAMENVEHLVAITEEIVGDLSQPNTGVLFALPVAAAWGLPKHPFGGSEGEQGQPGAENAGDEGGELVGDDPRLPGALRGKGENLPGREVFVPRTEGAVVPVQLGGPGLPSGDELLGALRPLRGDDHPLSRGHVLTQFRHGVLLKPESVGAQHAVPFSQV